MQKPDPDFSQGSGYASYQNCDVHTKNVHSVTLELATEASVQGYGHLFESFETFKIEIVPWPHIGTRSLMPNTGAEGGVAEGDFCFRWENERLVAENFAVNGDYEIGRAGIENGERKWILTREANYHPDGAQAIFPKSNEPFILLLAQPKLAQRHPDDLELDDFRAFYFTGEQGFSISPTVWHQPAFPLNDKAAFRNKQGRVHACIGTDTVLEFGKWLKVSLTRPQ